MHRQIVSDYEALKTFQKGIDLVANTVKRTMGVNGKNVVLDTNPYSRPLITNDGVTIARDMYVKDRTENIGVKLIKEAAEKTNDNAGDGTTTTMILMQAMVNYGMKALSSGADGIELRKGINRATENILKYLQKEKLTANDIETLANVATISCRDAKLGKLIADIVIKSGQDGMVTIEDRFEFDTTYEQLEGVRLTGGYLLDSFINLPERQQTVFNDVPVLVTDRTLTMGEEMAKIMETVANMGKKEAIIIAAGIEGNALATAYLNWKQRNIFILPVRVLTYGDLGQGLLKDVAAITGATYLDEHEKTLLDITRDDFGRAVKSVTDKHNTTIISEDDKLKGERIKELEAAIKSASAFEAENLRERIAKLRSGMFTVKVGGRTESERNELKTRVDDAIKSAKAALENGVVAGGGSSLYRASKKQKKPDTTNDQGIGENIVYKSCEVPIEQMAQNSGVRLDSADLEDIQDPLLTIDFSKGEVVHAYDKGIIDPFKVVTECIENAATQAGLFLTLDAGVIDIEDEKAETVV